MGVVEVVLAVHRHLAGGGVAHAFGGALALAYYAEPRGTVDVDVNVFVSVEAFPPVVESLAGLGFGPEAPPSEWMPAAGVRLIRPGEPAPLDLFPSLDERYERVAARIRRFPFAAGSATLPFLSAEDLILFKLSFGRDKDWIDVRRLVDAQPQLDVAYVEDQLIGLRGPSMYPRVARLRSLVRSAGG